MSSEAHEPCAAKGRQTIGDYLSGNFWVCRVCTKSFVMALGEFPVACPCCGVSYTVLLIDGEYRTHDELRR